MNRLKQNTSVLVLLILGLSLSGCLLSDEMFFRTITTTGQVVEVSTDTGAFYGLLADFGQSYYPLNLDNDFKLNNLRVTFSGRIRDDIDNDWGLVIELTSIRQGN